VGLFQAVSVHRDEAGGYALAPRAAANADEHNTRFLCRFSWGGAGAAATALGGFPVPYKYVHAKQTGQSMFGRVGPETEAYWLATLLFTCLVPGGHLLTSQP